MTLQEAVLIQANRSSLAELSAIPWDRAARRSDVLETIGPQAAALDEWSILLHYMAGARPGRTPAKAKKK